MNSHPDRDALALFVTEVIARAIANAVDARGQATVALAGGSTPALILPGLFGRPLAWNAVTLTLGDERWTADGALRNDAAIERMRAGTPAAAAAFVPLLGEPATLEQDADTADARVTGLPAFDLVWAGVGADGHTLSWFPGPDLDAALTSDRMVVAVRPEPLPAAAPVPRLTLTRGCALSAKQVLVVATGADKLPVLERPGDHPVGALIAATHAHVHWAP